MEICCFCRRNLTSPTDKKKRRRLHGKACAALKDILIKLILRHREKKLADFGERFGDSALLCYKCSDLLNNMEKYEDRFIDQLDWDDALNSRQHVPTDQRTAQQCSSAEQQLQEHYYGAGLLPPLSSSSSLAVNVCSGTTSQQMRYCVTPNSSLNHFNVLPGGLAPVAGVNSPVPGTIAGPAPHSSFLPPSAPVTAGMNPMTQPNHQHLQYAPSQLLDPQNPVPLSASSGPLDSLLSAFSWGTTMPIFPEYPSCTQPPQLGVRYHGSDGRGMQSSYHTSGSMPQPQQTSMATASMPAMNQYQEQQPQWYQSHSMAQGTHAPNEGYQQPQQQQQQHCPDVMLPQQSPLVPVTNTALNLDCGIPSQQGGSVCTEIDWDDPNCFFKLLNP